MRGESGGESGRGSFRNRGSIGIARAASTSESNFTTDGRTDVAKIGKKLERYEWLSTSLGPKITHFLLWHVWTGIGLSREQSHAAVFLRTYLHLK